MFDHNLNHWHRIEMRFVDSKAKRVIEEYLLDDANNFLKLAQELLLTQLDIKVPPTSTNDFTGQIIITDSNRSRWETWTKWTEFVDSIKKIDLNSPTLHDVSLEKTKQWVINSTSKANLALMLGLYEADKTTKVYSDFVNDNIIEASEKFDVQQLAKVNNYRKKNGLPVLTMKQVWAILDNKIKV